MMCDMCHDDGYVMRDGEIMRCPHGCDIKAAFTTDELDAGFDDDGYEHK